jgi:hypothetical protein
VQGIVPKLDLTSRVGYDVRYLVRTCTTAAFCRVLGGFAQSIGLTNATPNDPFSAVLDADAIVEDPGEGERR